MFADSNVSPRTPQTINAPEPYLIPYLTFHAGWAVSPLPTRYGTLAVKKFTPGRIGTAVTAAPAVAVRKAWFHTKARAGFASSHGSAAFSWLNSGSYSAGLAAAQVAPASVVSLIVIPGVAPLLIGEGVTFNHSDTDTCIMCVALNEVTSTSESTTWSAACWRILRSSVAPAVPST